MHGFNNVPGLKILKEFSFQPMCGNFYYHHKIQKKHKFRIVYAFLHQHGT